MNLRDRLFQCRLYGFVDTAYLAGRNPGGVARQLVEGGADIIQLRAKNESRDQIADMARAILPVTRPAGVALILNDFPDLAKDVHADGVHLGQEDLRVVAFDSVRAMLGEDGIIGVSTHSLDQALAAERLGADYIGVGPIFPTGTKPERPAVGLELIRQVVGRVRLPFVCIGGINRSNVAQVRQAGAKWIAVVSAILCSDEMVRTARDLRAAMQHDEPECKKV